MATTTLDNQLASNNKIMKPTVVLFYISLCAKCNKISYTTKINIILKHMETHRVIIMVYFDRNDKVIHSMCRGSVQRVGVTGTFIKNFSRTNSFYKIYICMYRSMKQKVCYNFTKHTRLYTDSSLFMMKNNFKYLNSKGQSWLFDFLLYSPSFSF